MLSKLVCILFLLFCCASAPAEPALCVGHLVTVEPDGTAARGSKENLKAAVRSGLPIRVGFELDFDKDGRADLTHWTDAIFISEFEDEIFTQFPQIHRQSPIRGKKRVDLPPAAQYWTGSIGTNGILTGHMSDAAEVNSVSVRSHWCIDSRAPREEWPDELRGCVSSEPQWRMLYQNDIDGQPLSGSKEALFDAVRRGYPIRFAWGTSVQRGEQRISVEHSADAVFVSIMGNTELFAQTPEHVGQTSYHDPSQAKLDKPSVMWRAMMGTTGEFDAVFVDRATGEVVKRIPQRARIAWFALAPAPECETKPPLELAVPKGVVLQESQK